VEGGKNLSGYPFVLCKDGRGKRISNVSTSTKSLIILYNSINLDSFLLSDEALKSSFLNISETLV